MNSKNYRKWQEDYRKVALSEREKVFTFIPEEAVTNPQEFSSALFAYADANDLDLVITKESMYPEFTINGIEYTAERFYTSVQRVPVAVIRCSVKHPEDFEPDVPEKRKKLMKLINAGWLLVPIAIVALILYVGDLLRSWEGWVIIVSFSILIIVMHYRGWFFHFNDKH